MKWEVFFWPYVGRPGSPALRVNEVSKTLERATNQFSFGITYSVLDGGRKGVALKDLLCYL